MSNSAPPPWKGGRTPTKKYVCSRKNLKKLYKFLALILGTRSSLEALGEVFVNYCSKVVCSRKHPQETILLFGIDFGDYIIS